MSSPGRPFLEARNLSYGRVAGRVLAEGLSFSMKAGEILLVTGKNGSGKSTLLRVLMGQLPVLKGQLEVAVDRSKIGFLPQMQNPGFHLPLTLRDVLAISLPGTVHWEDVLKIGLLDSRHLDLAWNTASGGERKRTLLTRLLLQKPSLLLLDEPMNHLDVESRQRVKQVLERYLTESEGAARAIVLVSHDPIMDQEFRKFGVVSLALTGHEECVECGEGCS